MVGHIGHVSLSPSCRLALPCLMSLQCPVVQLDCPILEGPSRCEVWSGDHPVRLYKDSGLSAAISGDLLFGSITAFEDPAQA